jgi:hypothetical protein
MTVFEDRLTELIAFMNEQRYPAGGTEDFFQAVLDHSLKYVEQGKDLKENYARLLTVALFIVNTLDVMIYKCNNEGALQKFQNYRRLVNSFEYDAGDVMMSYEKLRDIFEKLLLSSTYFGFCESLADARPVRSK